MKKLKFFKENISDISVKLDSYTSFEKELADFILKEIIKINFENVDYNKSIVEVSNDAKKGYLFFHLVSNKNNIELNISLFKNVIEMYVAGEGHPKYDSYAVKKKNIDKVKENLKNWLNRDIFRETTYYKGDIKKDIYFYIDCNSKEKIIYKSESLNYLFKKGEEQERKYLAWIKSEDRNDSDSN